MPRKNSEFSDTDLVPWKGVNKGIHEKILSKDEITGAHTRMLKFEPGSKNPEVLTHEFYEEVYILKGTLTDTRLGQTFTEGMYAFRSPGMKHGPYVSSTGCITIEFRYYGLKKKEA